MIDGLKQLFIPEGGLIIILAKLYIEMCANHIHLCKEITDLRALRGMKKYRFFTSWCSGGKLIEAEWGGVVNLAEEFYRES